MKLFRKQREKTLQRRSLGQYLLYALSEILLVVIGILIAVYLNNKNEQSKDATELKNILSIIKNDIENDISEAKEIISTEENKSKLYNDFFSEKITKDDYSEDRKYRFLIFGFKEISFDKRGYDLLKSFKNNIEISQDSLIVQIINLYSDTIEEVKADDRLRNLDFESNYNYWKNQKWWSDYIRQINNDDFIDYALNNQDYKNRVASWNFITLKVFVPELKNFIKKAEQIQHQIEKEFLKDEE